MSTFLVKLERVTVCEVEAETLEQAVANLKDAHYKTGRSVRDEFEEHDFYTSFGPIETPLLKPTDVAGLRSWKRLKQIEVNVAGLITLTPNRVKSNSSRFQSALFEPI
jgi:hypothetical protein